MEIGLIVALKKVFELSSVKTGLEVFDTGINIASFFDIIKSKLSRNSMEYQMVSALDEAFEAACEELGWEYDVLAVPQEFDLKSTERIVMTKNSLTVLLGSLTGRSINNEEAEVFTNCFDKSVAKNDKLFRYITQKWARYIEEENNKKGSKYVEDIPMAITRIPVDVALIGRSEDIASIKEHLNQYGIVSIKADGGVGKTAIALKIANDFKREIYDGKSYYKHIAWITSSGNLKNDLAGLDIPTTKDQINLEDKLSSVYAFLQNNPVFIVIDNMDSIPTAEDKSILNTIIGRTRLIITSRVEIDGFYEYRLPEIDNISAEKLFYRNYLDHDIPLDEIQIREDYEIVQYIVKCSSNNALLIELLGKIAFSENKNLFEFVSSLEGRVFNIESEVSLHTAHAEHYNLNQEGNAGLTSQGQIKRLYQMSGLTQNQMDILSFFALFPAGLKVFSKLFEWCGFSVDDIQWLLKRGWVKKDEDCYSMHPIVKSSIELQNREIGLRVDLNKYKNMLNQLIDTQQYLPIDIEFFKYKERAAIPKWICFLLENEECLDNDTMHLEIHLMLCVSELYRVREGNYKQALDYCFKALDGVIQIYGDVSQPTAGLYNRIAMIYFDDSEYERALFYLKKDYVISLKTKATDLEMAYTYNLLGETYGKLRKFAVAKYYFVKALVVLSNNPQDSAEERSYLITKAHVYDNLGNMYNDWGKYKEALRNHHKALVIYETFFGKKIDEIATSYNNIGLTYYYLGMLNEAQFYYEKSLSIRANILNGNHPFLIGTYIGLMQVYNAQGNKEAVQRIEHELMLAVGVIDHF